MKKKVKRKCRVCERWSIDAGPEGWHTTSSLWESKLKAVGYVTRETICDDCKAQEQDEAAG